MEVAVAAFQVSLAYRVHRDLKDKMAQQVLKVPQVAKDLRVLLVPRAIKEPEASKVKRVSSFLWIQFSVAIKFNEIVHARNGKIDKEGFFGL